MTEKISKTREEWKLELTPEQFEICINKGTEPPFSGKYCYIKEKGVYKCSCCGEPLFRSDTTSPSVTWRSRKKRSVKATIARMIVAITSAKYVLVIFLRRLVEDAFLIITNCNSVFHIATIIAVACKACSQRN